MDNRIQQGRALMSRLHKMIRGRRNLHIHLGMDDSQTLRDYFRARDMICDWEDDYDGWNDDPIVFRGVQVLTGCARTEVVDGPAPRPKEPMTAMQKQAYRMRRRASAMGMQNK